MFVFVGVLALDDVTASMKPGSKALASTTRVFRARARAIDQDQRRGDEPGSAEDDGA